MGDNAIGLIFVLIDLFNLKFDIASKLDDSFSIFLFELFY